MVAQVGSISSVQVRSGSRGAHFPPCPPSSPSPSPSPSTGVQRVPPLCQEQPPAGRVGEGLPRCVDGVGGWQGESGRMEKVKTKGIRKLRTGGGIDDQRKEEQKLSVFFGCR